MESEYAGAQLGDLRRSQRLTWLAKRIWRSPAQSIPKVLGEAGSEAFYRFTNNAAVSPKSILQPHLEETCRRAAEEEVIVVAHDTTDIKFEGVRHGLGELPGRKQGFFLHAALGVSLRGKRKPLGLLGMQTVFRRQATKGKRSKEEVRQDNQRESLRWHDLRSEVGVRARSQGFEVIHTMDREADDYELFSEILADGERFVIRVCRNRNLAKQAGGGKLFETLEMAPKAFYRDVDLSPRTKRKGKSRQDLKSHPLRRARRAKLAFSATAVEIPRPTYLPDSLAETLSLNVVHIVEVGAPAGEEPVQWRLFTTESIDTQKDIERIADIYLSRWLIEEFFKSLKTGCGFQKRQLENVDSILNALALFMPIAFGLLLLRYLGQEREQESGEAILSQTQIAVLRAFSTQPLPPNPTARELMLAVASLGGHLKRNGDPGWLVLGRGYQEMLTLEQGWVAAMRMKQASDAPTH